MQRLIVRFQLVLIRFALRLQVLRLRAARHCLLRLRNRRFRRLQFRSDGGQATAEYALVLLGVAAIALLVLAWAAQSGKIGQLFDAVVDNLIGKVR